MQLMSNYSQQMSCYDVISVQRMPCSVMILNCVLMLKTGRQPDIAQKECSYRAANEYLWLGPCSCLTQIVCYKSTVTGQQISMQLVWPDYVLPKMSAVKGQVCGSK